MRVLFLDPPGYQHQGYNLGLALLCASLAREGHQTLIFDRNEGGDLDQVISGFQPNLLGVSVKSATYSAGLRMAAQASALQPEALVVAGGPHPTINPEDMLSGSSAVDVSLSGESEHCITNLCRRLEKLGPGAYSKGVRRSESGCLSAPLSEALSDLPGACFRSSTGDMVKQPKELVAELDALPFPRLEAFANLDAGTRPYHLMTSRGCPFRCAYCSVRSIAGRRLRTRSVESVVEEILFAKSCYGIQVFEVDDDNFTLQIDRAKMFCEVLLQRRVDLPWYLPNGIRAEMLDRELAYLLALANCHTVALGIETSDPQVLKTIHKGIKPEEIRRGVAILKEAGIRVMGFFIIGLPGSNLQRDLRTIQFERSLDLDDRIYNAFVPYPCTEGFEWAQKNGRFLADYRDALHFSDTDETVFDTADYPEAQRKSALTLARLGTKNLTHKDFSLLRDLVLSGLNQDALLISVESYYPDIHEVLRRFVTMTVIHVRDRTTMEVCCEGPDGEVLMRSPLHKGWRHDLSLALGIGRALTGKQYDLLIVPQIHSYLILSMLARGRTRFQYSYDRKLSSITPREILLGSSHTFFRGRFHLGLRSTVPDPIIVAEHGYKLLTHARENAERLQGIKDQIKQLPRWLEQIPGTAALAALSELGISSLKLKRKIGAAR